MYPVLFHVFGFPIHSFGVMIIVGFLVGYWLASRRADRYGISKSQLSDIAVFGIVAGIIGGRVGWVVQEWGYYWGHLSEIPRVWDGGMTSYGGILFGVLAVWIASRRAKVPLPNALDLIAVPGLVMHGFGRIGCFLNGCCYGGPCSLPWAIHLRPDKGSDYLGHPAQLYDTLLSLAFAGLLFWYESRTFKDRKPGTYAALFFALYGVSRYIFEVFRAGYSSTSSFAGFPLTDGQVAALVMVLIGAIWLALLRKPGKVAE